MEEDTRKQMKRIDKRIARRLFYEGRTIYLLPSNVGLDSMYVIPCPITYEASKIFNKLEFDNLVNMYEYYNCVKELGRYAKYYIKEEK